MAESAAEAPRSTNGGVRGLLAGMRARVLVTFLVLLVVSTAASVLVLRAVLMSRIGDEATATLTSHVEEFRERAERLPRDAGGARAQAARLFDGYLPNAPPPPDGALVAYVGEAVYAERSAVAEGTGLIGSVGRLAGTTRPASGSLETEAGEARYVSVPVTAGEVQGGTFIAAKLLSGQRQDVEDAVQVAIGVSLVVLLLASLFIWLAAGRVVAPVQALSRTARSITDTDLSRRIPVRGNDEIAELGRTFNGMLDRLEIAFANQREFIADISHELRTPITVIRGHLETAGDDPRERREAGAVIADELSRMSRLVDDLLLLYRAPRPDFLRPTPIDLDLLTHDLLTKAQSLGERQWKLDGTGMGLLRADSQRLTQALMNLAENAVRNTAEGDVIALGSELRAGEARLWVRDEGPGIPAVDQQRIFERFATASRNGAIASAVSAGLGLSIVKAIAEAHGGRVELESMPGAGATFTVVVPADQPARMEVGS